MTERLEIPAGWVLIALESTDNSRIIFRYRDVLNGIFELIVEGENLTVEIVRDLSDE